jgi:hypothetical protein
VNNLRASSTANHVNKLITKCENEVDRFLVICGNVNMLYGDGIPDRIVKKHSSF